MPARARAVRFVRYVGSSRIAAQNTLASAVTLFGVPFRRPPVFRPIITLIDAARYTFRYIKVDNFSTQLFYPMHRDRIVWVRIRRLRCPRFIYSIALYYRGVRVPQPTPRARRSRTSSAMSCDVLEVVGGATGTGPVRRRLQIPGRRKTVPTKIAPAEGPANKYDRSIMEIPEPVC